MSDSLGEYIRDKYTKLQNNKDVKLSSQIFIGLIIIGCIVKLLTNGLGPESGFSAASGTIWGYLLVLCSMLGFIILTVDPTTDKTMNQFIIPWYLIVLIGIILWILSLNIAYYKQINRNNIPPVYTMWDTWSTMFIILIVCFVMLEYSTSDNTQKNNKVFNIIIGFILFINIIIVGIQHTILQNFSVDG